LLRVQRIGEPALSPDGKLVAYTVATPDLSNNKLNRQIYVVPVNNGFPRLLTRRATITSARAGRPILNRSTSSPAAADPRRFG